jgi:hypothetical protein
VHLVVEALTVGEDAFPFWTDGCDGHFASL